MRLCRISIDFKIIRFSIFKEIKGKFVNFIELETIYIKNDREILKKCKEKF